MTSDEELLDAYRYPGERPWVRANFIASLDGAATVDGLSGALNDAEDTRLLVLLRRLADVVLVGAGTVRAEGYGGLGLGEADREWRRERGMPPEPRLALVTSALDLSPDDDVFRALRPLVMTHSSAPSDKQDALREVAEIITCGDDALDIPTMINTLAEYGLGHILTEGGPQLFGSLIAADAVDELCLTVAPVLEGGEAMRISRGGPPALRPMRLGHALPGEDMLFLRYERQR